MKQKWLAVGIILLFVGVTIAPTINFNTVKASQEDDLVEVTTQACGIQGYRDTTVKLTRQQYQDLEEYLVEFRARLNQTTTREEAIPIFKEVVVELDKYGLLPKGMSVERAQKLVIGPSQNKRIMKLTEKILSTSNRDNNSNKFCLICGTTDVTYSFGMMKSLLCRTAEAILFDESNWLTDLLRKICHFLYYNISAINLEWLFEAFLIYSSFYIIFSSGIINTILPFNIFNVITMGGFIGDLFAIPGNAHYYSALGIVITIGASGIHNFTGSLYGYLPFYIDATTLPNTRTQNEYGTFGIYFPAIFGFTGLKLYNVITGRMTYIGSALAVNIGSEPPI